MMYVWTYFRCPRCHAYLVTVRAMEGTYPIKLPCSTVGCRGEQVSAEHIPVVDWPVTIIREATAEWYRPGAGLLLDMKRTNPKLWDAVVNKNRLILRKLDEPIVWTPDNDGLPKEPAFSLT